MRAAGEASLELRWNESIFNDLNHSSLAIVSIVSAFYRRLSIKWFSMGLRPAKTTRVVKGQPWTRKSIAKPRQSFVKGAPHPKIRQYDMGVDKQYDFEIAMVAEQLVRVRDNAIEAARQIANKYLEKFLAGNYFMKIMPYPHVILREHTLLGVAGADRISKGMKLAFGRPRGTAAQIDAGDRVFIARCYEKDLQTVKTALTRAQRKMSGKYRFTIGPAPKVAYVKEMKKIVEAAPTPTPAAAAPAPGAEAAPAEAKAGEGKEGKK